MDVGVNKGHYSVIGQGQVQLIVSASPEERRQYFEEAAGVVSYRQSKKETLRRLDEVQRNIEQVEVFLGDYESRMHGLKVQAGRAEKYLEYRKAHDEWVLAGSYRRYQQIRAELDEIERQKSDVSGEIEALETSSASTLALEASLAETRQNLSAEISGWEETLRGAERDRAEKDKLLAASEARLYSARRGLSEIDIAQAKLVKTVLGDASPSDRDVQSPKLQTQEIPGRDFLQSAKGADAPSRLSDLRKEVAVSLEQSDSELSRIDAELETTDGELRNLEERQTAEHDDIISAHEASAALESTLAALNSSAEEIRGRIETLAAQAAEDEQKRADLANQMSRLEQSRGAAGQAQTSSEMAVKEAESRMEVSRDRLMKLRAKLAEVEGRFRSLSAAEESREGFSASVRAVLERFDKRDEFVGVVRDLIEFDPAYTKAVEAALGPKLQHLIVSTGDTVKEILREVSGSLRGRVTFWALDLLPSPASARPLPAGDKIVGWAVRLLRFDSNLTRLFENLLGWTLVVEDMDTLLRVAKETRGISIVTLDGSYYRSGAITAGPTLGALLMGRKRELTESEERIKDMAAQMASEEETLQRACSELSASRAAQEAAFRRFKDADSEHVRVAASLDSCEHVAADRRARMESESAQLTEKLSAVSEARARQASAQELRGTGVMDLRPKIEELRRQIEGLRAERETAQRGLRTLQDRGRDLDRVESEFADLSARRAVLEEEIRSIEADMARLREELAGAESRASAAASELASRQARWSETLEQIESSRAEVSRISEHLQTLREARHRQDIRLTALSAEIANLKENVQSDVQVDLDSLTEAPAPPEGFETLNPEDIAGRLQEIQMKIHKLGAVNVNAIDEYNEVAAKHADLQKQLADLGLARDTLKDVQRKTDRICKERFVEVFERVAANFEQVTKKLFLGGEGKLILTESEELLESGVDIQLRPPGKGFTSLASRSGGEQSLAGLCLLFALFMEKPSPFCMLDEVDAALDDSNVGRLAKLIGEFSDKIQFVIVTHNKLTMQAASCLFGATMEEAGITKLISVRMKQAEEAALAAAS
ncbi:chromosome segregation protein SMC [bacterium]|nr:chromosome segregation protein SMC [bacterium]